MNERERPFRVLFPYRPPRQVKPVQIDVSLEVDPTKPPPQGETWHFTIDGKTYDALPTLVAHGYQFDHEFTFVLTESELDWADRVRFPSYKNLGKKPWWGGAPTCPAPDGNRTMMTVRSPGNLETEVRGHSFELRVKSEHGFHVYDPEVEEDYSGA